MYCDGRTESACIRVCAFVCTFAIVSTRQLSFSANERQVVLDHPDEEPGEGTSFEWGEEHIDVDEPDLRDLACVRANIE